VTQKTVESKGADLINAIRAVNVKFGSKISAACLIAKRKVYPLTRLPTICNEAIPDKLAYSSNIIKRRYTFIHIYVSPYIQAQLERQFFPKNITKFF
jgi:hypothetical protein